MLPIIGITFPIFALIGIGYAATRWGPFQPADSRPFGAFVLNFALPAMLLQATSSRPVREVLDMHYLGLYALTGLVTIAATYLWFTPQTGPARRIVGAMGSACPNSGFVGYPMFLILFPGLAGQVLAMNFMVENIVFIPLVLAMLDMTTGRAALGRTLLRVLVGMVKRPMVIALVVGLTLSATGVTLPLPAARLLEMIANAAAALSLFVIGGSMVGIELKGNVVLATQIAAAKLLLMPAIAVALSWIAAVLGAPMDHDHYVALVLSGALPMFSIYVVLAQTVGHAGLASIAQLIATSASFLTLTALLPWLV